MRLGIFGGTFDPIHFGHLRTAEAAREEAGLDRVLFIPNRISPFKTDRPVTPPDVRIEMVRRAIADNPAFEVSGIELERPGPSYTVDTVGALAEEYPEAELYFIAGFDALKDLRAWRRPEELLRLARIIGMARPGVAVEELRNAFPPEWGERISFAVVPLLEISSTDLRARLSQGKSVRYLMPAAVESLARERGLYRKGPAAPPIQGVDS